MPVRFPFGHGLSYATFEYKNLRLSTGTLAQDGTLEVKVDVTNTGRMGAKEIVQLYVHSAHEGVSRPVQELKGFEKVYIAPGQTETVSFRLCRRAFSYYNPDIHDWYAEGGKYELRVGASSRDIRLTAEVELEPGKPLPVARHGGHHVRRHPQNPRRRRGASAGHRRHHAGVWHHGQRLDGRRGP